MDTLRDKIGLSLCGILAPSLGYLETGMTKINQSREGAAYFNRYRLQRFMDGIRLTSLGAKVYGYSLPHQPHLPV